ncbi:hypothetical protein [Mogibacterium diversum]
MGNCESRAQYLKICKILADVKLEIKVKFKDGILACEIAEYKPLIKELFRTSF